MGQGCLLSPHLFGTVLGILLKIVKLEKVGNNEIDHICRWYDLIKNLKESAKITDKTKIKFSKFKG